MFIYSIKGNTLKFIGLVCLAAVLMVSLLVLVPKDAVSAEPASADALSFDKISSNKDRIAFLAQFGWEVDKKPVKEAVVRIPDNFDEIMKSYNELQKKVGLDLEKNAGKEAVRYTYKVKNYPDYEGDVFANVVIFKKKVIAGDVCSSDVDGFIRDLTFPEAPGKDEGEDSAAGEEKATGTTAPDTSADTASETAAVPEE